MGRQYTFNGLVSGRPSYKKSNGNDKAMVFWNDTHLRWEIYINYLGEGSGNDLGNIKELIGTQHTDDVYPPQGPWESNYVTSMDTIIISY